MEYFRKEQPESRGILRTLDEVQTDQANQIKEAIEDYESVSPLENRERKKKERKVRKQSSVRELLGKLVEEKETGEKKSETKVKKKSWKFPRAWIIKAKRSQKRRDAVLVFYLNIKGELEPPMVVPIYGGNMVIIRNKVYEVDPRAIWSVKVGFNKTYKLLIIKEIDRRPVSNLDWDDIRVRGDATDSDEFLIKAALRAQMTTTAKQMGKGAIILIVIGIIGGLIFFFMQ